jgi:hypothetical protein
LDWYENSVKLSEGSMMSRTNVTIRVVVFAVWLMAAGIAEGRVITVDDDGPADFDNIQAAINDASNGDIVEVRPGTYTGGGNRDMDFAGKAITVRSQSGPAGCTIDCQGLGRGFYFHSSEGQDSVLEGLTIINGYGDNFGGAILCDPGRPTISNCVFAENHADWKGGAICVFASGPLIVNCVFTGNSAQWGGGLEIGGVYGSEGPISINCTFVGNSATNTQGGGGVSSSSSGVVTLSNCILWGNTYDNGIGGRRGQISAFYAAINYCCIEGGSSGTGNIGDDPLFVDAANADYHLANNSPCVDAGTNHPEGGLPTTDLEGIARSLDGDCDGNEVADMGAYEYWIPIIEISPDEFEFSDVCGVTYLDDQILSIGNRSIGTLSWTITYDCDWLQVSPLNGQSTGEYGNVVLSVDLAGMSLGEYSCVLTISAAGALNSPEHVQVNLLLGRAELSVPTQEYPTIQAAIDAAVAGCVVTVGDGVYSSQGNRDIDFKGKAVIVRSENGPESCIIDCQGNELEPHRGFHFHSGEDACSVVQGFTITGGYADYGGGIYNHQSSPTIANCILCGNTAAMFGGAIENWSSSATVANCIFHDNYAQSGAGVDNDWGSPVFTNCIFSSNTATVSGGAVFGYYSSITMKNSILWGDTPEEIFVDGGSTTVSYSDVEGGFAGEGNIDADPCFADAASGDYHLLGGSPAINAGDPGSDWINEPWPNGVRINMGAYGNTPEATRSLVDFDDLATFASHWLTDEPVVDIMPQPHGNGIVNFLDFTAFADLWRGEQ